MQRDTSVKQLPYSHDAEQSVIGSILMDNEAMDKALDVLSADGRAFHSKAHQTLFKAFAKLYHDRKPIDVVTVLDAIDEKDLNSACGAGYMGELTEMTPTATNVEYYAKIVRDKSVNRYVIHQFRDLMDKAYSEEVSADELYTMAQQAFIKSDHMVKKIYHQVNDILREVSTELIDNKGKCAGISTGLYSLNDVLGGFQNTDLILIAGRPSMGKTALAVQIATDIALDGKRVGIFSIEVGRKQLVKNMCANQTGIDTTKFRDGQMDDSDYGLMTKFSNSIHDTSIRIDDSSRSSRDISRQARKMKMDGGLDIILIDHIQLMRENIKGINRNQELEIISGNLKALAKELNIPVVAVSQLSRNVEHRGGNLKPRLSDLRESGAIEQDADVIMFVFRDEYYTREESKLKGIAEIIIAKHRNGGTGTIKLRWTPECVRFDNLERNYGE